MHRCFTHRLHLSSTRARSNPSFKNIKSPLLENTPSGSLYLLLLLLLSLSLPLFCGTRQRTQRRALIQGDTRFMTPPQNCAPFIHRILGGVRGRGWTPRTPPCPRGPKNKFWECHVGNYFICAPLAPPSSNHQDYFSLLWKGSSSGGRYKSFHYNPNTFGLSFNLNGS